MSIRDVMMTQDMGMVKSVQRGEYDSHLNYASSRPVATITLSPVNISKSIVILNADMDNMRAYSMVNGKLQSATELLLYSTEYVSADQQGRWRKVNWQVIEFY